MKSANTTVAATVSAILKARPLPRSALLLLSSAGLLEGLAPSPAAATTLAGLTGRTATTITSTAAPIAPTAGATGHKNDPHSTTPAQSQADFSTALAAIQKQLAAQANAHAAALAAPSSVPDGLASGGLQVAPGMVWQGANNPTQSQSNGQTAVEIDQTAAQAILNWSTFNVGKNTTLYYNQTPGTHADGTNTWVALNRVNDPSGVPSQILGQIKAEGSVYVVNHNGVIFGGSSQVDVHTLVASSLDITDSQFLAGIVQPSLIPASSGSSGTPPPLYPPAFGNASGQAADIVVQPGALIKTTSPPSVTSGGGTILLLGGNVDNAGSLIAPDGQVLLAAGTTAYLYDSPDSSVRGAAVNVLNGGTVTNEAGGYISAPTGNITLAGMSLQQKGVLAASTSINEAGSIVLAAGDGIRVDSELDQIVYYYLAHETRTGTVALSAGSLTAVLPEEDGLKALDGQPQGQSFVRLEGEAVDLLGGSLLFAPGAKVQLDASSDPFNFLLAEHPAPGSFVTGIGSDAGRVYVGNGATIDVAGMKDVLVDASEDVVEVNVRGNELRDDLAQQGGILTAANVWVNVHDLLRVAPDRIYTAGGLIEVSGWLGLTPRLIDERLTQGGSVSLLSTGDAILRPGSLIDISGGTIDHQGGYVNHTNLLGADGRVYDINTAPAEVQYVSIGTTTHDTDTRWNISSSFANGLLSGKLYESGYLEGKSAGSLSIFSNQVELDSTVNAAAVNGPYQRTALSLPKNGSLNVGGQIGLLRFGPGNVSIGPAMTAPTDVFATNVVTGLFPEDPNYPTGPQRARDPSTLLPSADQQTLFLSSSQLSQEQFGSITINANSFTLAGGSKLTLGPAGALIVDSMGSVSIAGSIRAPGGAVTLNATANTGTTLSSDIELKPGATIDTRGMWVNDALSPGESTPLLYNGGNVTLSAQGNVLLDAGSLIDASSGGWVQANGALKTAGGLPVGQGGDIALLPDANRGLALYSASLSPDAQSLIVTNPAQTYPYQLVLDGTVRSAGFTGGGTLSLAAPQIAIGSSASSGSGGLALDPSFFTQGGFSGYHLFGFQGVSIAAGTDIELHGTGFAPTQALRTVATGADFAAVTSVGPTSALVAPHPVDFLVSATDPFAGDVSVGQGAVINTDPDATVALHAQHDLYFDGTIRAPAGAIYLDLYGSPIPTSTADDPYSGKQYSNPGYDPTQTLWIGADARLLAPGFIASYGDPAAGAITNVVRPGGSVHINSDALDALYYPDLTVKEVGAIPLGTVVAASGSVVDVSGAAESILVPGTGPVRGDVPQPIVSGGGSVTIAASLGLLWDASIDAHGGGTAAPGGSLTLGQLGHVSAAYILPAYTEPVFELVLSQHATNPAPGLAHGGAVPPSLSGQLYFSADQIASSGVENVSFAAADALGFNGDVNLHVADSLTINARNLTATPGANVTLSAPYVAIGGPNSGYAAVYPAAASVAGSANLTVNAGLIDITTALNSGAGFTYTSTYTGGVPFNPVTTTISLPGFAAMDFNSTGDIRLVPQSLGKGYLYTQGNLNFDANQVYTVSGDQNASFDRFVIEANGPNSVITFARNSSTMPAVPLSAASVLQIIAPTIVQGGVLRTPMGQIIFGDPNNPTYSSVTLLPGSVTSVSADGALIPWGQPSGTTSWVYGYSLNGSSPVGYTVRTPPAKEVDFYGAAVNVQHGAVLDESGGGDLYGAQFVSGRSGSVDVLTGTQTFAVLPSLGAAPAPVDPLMTRSDGGGWTDPTPVALRTGDQVYLSGVPGLAAGYYTLLPGHYALLPGGFRVTVSESQLAPADLVPTQHLLSGSYLVPGYRFDANTGRQDQLPSEFLVTPGSVFRQEAQYDESTLGQFFAAQAAAAGIAPTPLPADAGRLVLQASNSLIFQGTGDFSVGKGGRGGQADIVGTNLFISGSASDAVPNGDIGLGDAALNAIGAQSLLIGGTRSLSSNTVTITPSAQTIEIAGDAQLKAPEVLVVASSSVTLDPGAQIDTTGFAALPPSFPTDPKTGLTLGKVSIAGSSAAFLQASNGPLLPVTLSTTGSSTGTLTFGAGAGVYAKDNLVIGTSNTVGLDPTTQLEAPTVDVAADVINVGDGSTGFTLSPALLNSIAKGDSARGLGPTSTLMLSASSAINTYGSAELGTFDASSGSYSLQSLIISAPLIQGTGVASDTARIAAQQITLQGATTPGTGISSATGSLELDTAKLTLGPGAMTMAGYQRTALNASDSVTGNGTGIFNVAGDLAVASALITGVAKADTTLTATGAVQLTRPGGAGGVEGTSAGIGAHLSVNGSSVSQNTDLEFASGVVNLSGGSVSIGNGGVIDVAGALVPIFDVVRITPAGSINLTALSGNVTVASGSVLDLSAGDLTKLDRNKTPYVDPLSSDKGSDAGTLNILAPAGSATLDGTLKVAAVSGYEGGKAVLNLGTGDAASLLNALAAFSGEQDLALATGDINVASLTARRVDLSASSGNLTVTGLIDASGASGGDIQLNAGLSLTLASGAKLDARATAQDGKGGDVFLGLDGLSTGAMTLASGSAVDVSGTQQGGRLWLRAPRVGTTGVAIAPSSGFTVTGARDVTVEAVAVTDISANPYVDQALPGADAAASAYMANAAAIASSLGALSADPAFHLVPGIELRSSGDMTLLQNPTLTNDGIDLHVYRYNGEPMTLTLRAAGNLNINGSLSDGFDSPVTVEPDPVTGLSSGPVFAIAPLLPAGSPSATIRLVAGANLNAADPTALQPLSTLAAGEGSIILNAPQYDQNGGTNAPTYGGWQTGLPIPSVVRTGTGDLTLAAGRDIDFLSEFGVYTAGTPSAPVAGFTLPSRVFLPIDNNGSYAPTPTPTYFGFYLDQLTYSFLTAGYDTVYPTALQANYPTQGGRLTATAQGNLSSTTLPEPNGNTVYAGSEPDTFWLWTQWTGTTNFDQATWFINFGTYYQSFAATYPLTFNYAPFAGAPSVAGFVGLGALGGGRANVTVGGNMANVDVAVPTTGRIPTGTPYLARAVISGGGDLSVTVAGALDGGNLLAANGMAKVRATDIGPTTMVDFVAGNDVRFDAYADRNLNASIGDMTRVSNQQAENLPAGDQLIDLTVGLEGTLPIPYAPFVSQPGQPYGYFTSYTAGTSMAVRSGGGDIIVSGDYTPAIMDLTADTGSVRPGTLTGAAGYGIPVLFAIPEPNSQIDILAGKDVRLGFSTNGLAPDYYDATPKFLYGYAGTVANFEPSGNLLSPLASNLVQPNDPGTDHVYALTGSIIDVNLATSKETQVRAGLDINAPLFILQNNNEGDVSVVQAGRDITSCEAAPSICGVSYLFDMQIGGPGYLVVQAGRNLLVQSDMTPSVNANFIPVIGIASVGNAYNTNLPSDGASLTVNIGVGAGPQDKAFIDAYIDPATAGGIATPYTSELVDYMQKRTGKTLAVSDAVAAFRALEPEQQAPLIEKVYFAEVRAGGRIAAAGLGAGGKGFDRSYKAIQTLFPGSQIGQPTTAYSGDLSMYGYGKIRTDAGGDIGIVVPGGDITLGFENQTPDLANDPDTAKPGVLTLRGGNIDMVSDGSQIVAQSRVFTELGGDIMMWSTNGDVNAGKGKKTSIVTSPPQITYDPYGNITKSAVTPQTGAGIASLIGVPGVQPGDVDLFAPHGTVDAGDAGIRVSGNLYIAAQQVANADNIQVQGKAVGLPPQPVTDLALTTASAAATQAAAILKPLATQEARTTVDVEVTGFGGDDPCAAAEAPAERCPRK